MGPVYKEVDAPNHCAIHHPGPHHRCLRQSVRVLTPDPSDFTSWGFNALLWIFAHKVFNLQSHNYWFQKNVYFLSLKWHEQQYHGKKTRGNYYIYYYEFVIWLLGITKTLM